MRKLLVDIASVLLVVAFILAVGYMFTDVTLPALGY